MARLHLNWGACADWHAARASLRSAGLKATLYSNFADLDGDAKKICKALKAKGFVIEVEPDGASSWPGATLIRLSDPA